MALTFSEWLLSNPRGADEKLNKTIDESISNKMPCEHQTCRENRLSYIKVKFSLLNYNVTYTDETDILSHVKAFTILQFQSVRANAARKYCTKRKQLPVDEGVFYRFENELTSEIYDELRENLASRDEDPQEHVALKDEIEKYATIIIKAKGKSAYIAWQMTVLGYEQKTIIQTLDIYRARVIQLVRSVEVFLDENIRNKNIEQ